MRRHLQLVLTGVLLNLCACSKVPTTESVPQPVAAREPANAGIVQRIRRLKFESALQPHLAGHKSTVTAWSRQHLHLSAEWHIAASLMR